MARALERAVRAPPGTPEARAGPEHIVTTTTARTAHRGSRLPPTTRSATWAVWAGPSAPTAPASGAGMALRATTGTLARTDPAADRATPPGRPRRCGSASLVRVGRTDTPATAVVVA